jgi:dTDP-4-amino-4,6-dideoxygalactose transaminase
MKENGVGAVFHYLSLHSSEFYRARHDGRALPECDRYADCLVRLPLFFDLQLKDVETITDVILSYYAD